MSTTDPKVVTCLWFDDDLEEAVTFWTGLFPDSDACGITVPAEGETRAVSADWVMLGQRFRGINGGPMFRFTEAVSLSVTCEDQAEVDRYWDALTADGGEESQCAWLKDRFGLSWQIVPTRLPELLADPDPARARAAAEAMRSMRSMRKIVIADLEAAVDSA